MLFDLRGKRRRLIQVVYAFLAVIMGGSLVMFGIGSDAPGGIFDGVFGDGTGPANPQYEQQLSEAEEILETDPQNQEALLEVARYRYLIGQLGITGNPETGERTVTPEAREHFDEANEAWQTYLDTDPTPPDVGMARNIAQVNEILFSEALARGEIREGLQVAEDVAEAARIAVRQDPTAPEYGTLARFLFIAGKDNQGDRALEQALELVDTDDRDQIEATLSEQRREARRLHRDMNEILEAGDDGTGAIEDPFGGLGGGAGPGIGGP